MCNLATVERSPVEMGHHETHHSDLCFRERNREEDKKGKGIFQSKETS